MNVPPQPAQVPRTPHRGRVLRSCHDCAVCRGKNQPEGWPLHRRRVRPPQFRFASTETKRMFSKAFLLTCLRTLAPANSFLSHTSLKHPGVVCTPSNCRLLYQLRTPHLASCAPTPYPWAIALRFSWCHNRLSGWLPVRRVAFGRSTPPGHETFRRFSVSNTLSGRGLGKLLPIRSAKRPDVGKWYLGRPLWPRPGWASSPSSASCLRTG
jgi:hypothetical protein